MSTITKPNTFSAGAVIVAAEHNSNFDTIYNDYNGNITNANLSASAALAASKLNLSTIAQTIAMSSVAINFAKGSDIASATTTDIGAMTGNYADVTGTTTITGLGTVQAGTVRFVRFTAALTLTHNATSLILPSAANITTAANDVAGFVSLGSGNWKCLWYQRYSGEALIGAAASGSTIQTVLTQSSAVATDSGVAVDDDTIPTVTECPVITALNTTITASSASNTLIVTAVLNLQTASVGAAGIAALFIDSDANAISAARFNATGFADLPFTVVIQFSVSPADTSAHTYKIGIGGADGVITLNGAAGSRKLGGVLYSSLKIEEIKA